jgi:serine phosphatase RsbU (regulator of sigma subunit)
LFLLNLSSSYSQISITFRVISPALSDDEEIYITGNESALGSWNPGIRPLEKGDDGIWTRTFQFQDNTDLEYKITRGSWQTEAVDSTGIEYPNFTHNVKTDTVVTLNIRYWRDTYSEKIIISADRLLKKAGNIEFFEKWKYHHGDDSSWADPQYDDRDWLKVNSTLTPTDLGTITWEGIGWFRLHIEVDSSLWRMPLALYVRQAGALEIFLNGQLLYKYGTVAENIDDESALIISIPQYIMFDNQKDQVIAVRFSNVSSQYISQIGGAIGFNIQLRDLNMSINENVNRHRDMTVYQMIFTILPLTLAFLHLLLFIFYRDMRENLYFGIFMICFAFLAYSDFQPIFVKPLTTIIFWIQVNFIAVILTFLFGIFTSYQRTYSRLHRNFYLFSGFAFILVVWNFIKPSQIVGMFLYLYIFLSAAELVRVNIINLKKKDKWEWVIGISFFIMVLIVIYQYLISTSIVEPIGNQNLVYVYGILIVSIAASINLARDFSKVQQTLLLQEREAKEQEIKSRVLEADNIRKTQELEEARQLQLSMLPKKIPQLPHLDIAVYMKTATEVGGDYYDFKVEEDGTLTIVIGDATGHGTKAGIMVTLIKNIFNTMGHTFFIPDFFKHTTKLIKQMNLGHLYMALLLIKMKDKNVQFSSAGMPPIFVFRTKDKTIEEQVIKGLPLGGIESFSYTQGKFEVYSGDIILMMTDGFAELFNPKGDMIDFPLVKDIFLKSADKSADDIIHHLVDFGEKWRSNRPQNDDITFIVIKII